jgi:glycosyltransferase involved in cell wall biosynthesis
MQDPWHSEYYRDKPKDQRPPKYWFSYRLNKWLEPIAMKAVGGLISVSEKYISDLQNRYQHLKNIPTATITFGAFELDNQIAQNNANKFKPLLNSDFKNLVYIGRGGADMQKALNILFEAVKRGQEKYFDLFKKLKITFIGTSYAPAGHGKQTILPVAQQFGVEDRVTEITDRISYYHTMLIMQQADALFIPGSDSEGYTASKLYPYLSSNKPLLAIIKSKSPAVSVLQEYGVENTYHFDQSAEAVIATENFLTLLLSSALTNPQYNPKAVEKYSALNITRKQCELFNSVIDEQI